MLDWSVVLRPCGTALIQNQEILLLHGIIKKSRAAPKHELDLARKRLLIYLKANL